MSFLKGIFERKPRRINKMPEVGIEPTRPGGHQILSLARLPIPPLRLFMSGEW